MSQKLTFIVTAMVWLLMGLLIGCGNQTTGEKKSGDSLFLKNLYAQSDTAGLAQANRQAHHSRETALTRAAAIARPAVVGINVLQVKRYVVRSPFYTDDPLWRALMPQLFRDQIYEKPIQSLGSGFFISPDGYLLTNEHVVQDAKKIVVTLEGGKRYDATLVGVDHVSDIALLKIEGENFPYLKMGDSDDLIVGEWVIALGNPFGLFELDAKPTVTAGIISATNVDWGRVPESNRIYMDMIQTDAAINHGNSGGPLVNALGQVIGMNTFIYTGSSYQEGFVGIGFAIPINRIKKVVAQLKAQGGVDRNYWLGIRVQDLNPFISRALGLDVEQGVIITQVERGSSADRAGLQPEDIIVKLDGHQVVDTQSLLQILTNADYQVGDVLTFTILRGNRTLKIHVKLIKQPEER